LRKVNWGTGRRGIRRTPDGDDQAAIDSDPAVPNWRPVDRQHPRRTMDDQWPVSRAFFSAALRAA
jgi:hypothetical protein